MNEEERRQEILKAEATIQQLANEMARASGVASQAEAARVALDAARLDVIKSVDELNEVISTQKTTNTEAMAALNQAKKSLEDAISTLTDVGVHIDRIETHINEAVNEIRATAKIVGLIPNRLSAALSRELSQADKSIEERHTALMQVSENNSNKLKEISQSIDDNHRNISGVLDSKFSQIDTASEEKHSASMQVLENNLNKLKEISQSIDDNHRNISEVLDSKFSQIDTASEEKHSASMQVLENNSNKLKEISQSIDDNHRNISEVLDSKFSQIDTASEEKHSASMQVLENNSNKLKEISQSIDDNHRNISKLLDSLTRWGVVFAALTLLGVWISAIILLFRG